MVALHPPAPLITMPHRVMGQHRGRHNINRLEWQIRQLGGFRPAGALKDVFENSSRKQSH